MRRLLPRLVTTLPRPAWGTGVLLFVLGAYLLTMSGHTYSPDEETMLEASRSLVERGTWAIPSSGSMVQVEGADGQQYSQYGPGQSLAAVPWVAVGEGIGKLFPKDQSGYPLRLVLGTFNALIAAAIAALFAALAVSLGYSRRAGITGALALAFCTYLWPHSRTFFSEPLTALGLLGSVYLLVRDKQNTNSAGTTLGLLAAGALFAISVATKVQYVVALPGFAIYLGLWAWQMRKQGFARALRVPLLWGAGLLAGILPLLWYNQAIFGSPLSTGYGADPGSTLTNPFFEGLTGLLISPGKGILWYALPLLLSLVGSAYFARKHSAEALFIVTASAPIIILFSLYSFWHGDGSWGPRYLIPILPFLLLPAMEVIEKAAGERQPASSITRTAVAGVLGLGFAVNLLGVAVNFDTYINVVEDLNARHWTVEGSPINGHLNLLDQRVTEWSARLFEPPGATLLRSGFSYSEGDKVKGYLLPRWTTGAGVLDIDQVSHDAVSLTLRLSDHRPPELARANVAILVNGADAHAERLPVDGAPITTDYVVSVPGSGAVITIQSDTWKPSDLQEGGRNESIGVKMEAVTITRGQGGTTLDNRLVEALNPPPYYPQPRWYYDPGTHHPADLWPIYILESGMGKKAAALLSLPVLLAGILFMLLGVRSLVQENASKQTL